MGREPFCRCPYILCRVHGNCRACMAKNREEETICYCMEKIAEKYEAKLPLRRPDTEVYETEGEMSARCAELVRETLQKKPDALLCFPAGTTVVGTCKILAEWKEKGEIDFSAARFVALDEWLDLADESENCASFLRRRLYGPLGLREEQLTLFDIHAKDLDAECRRMDQAIFDAGHIDLMLLGVGMNGHLGLNEPGEDFADYTKVVQLSETTKEVGQKYFSGGMRLSRGITLGMHHIFETKQVVLQIAGAHKQEIVYRLYHTRPDMELPASALLLMDQAKVVMDRAAAGENFPSG